MTIEQQIQTLISLGYPIQTATRLVMEAVALIPEGGALADYLPSAEQLDGPISDADAERAKAAWYAGAPDEFVRILDAAEVAEE